ncbi:MULTISPECIES: hypothetical protein [Pseudomonas]|nr:MULTISPECIES: hypothetical protein [Pseudomonas]MCU1740660.1 hypothetical protein [Pseudomonas sp. 20S_6.2_Bac1]
MASTLLLESETRDPQVHLDIVRDIGGGLFTSTRHAPVAKLA